MRVRSSRSNYILILIILGISCQKTLICKEYSPSDDFRSPDWVNVDGEWIPEQGGFSGNFLVSEFAKPPPDDPPVPPDVPSNKRFPTDDFPPGARWVQGTYSSIDKRPCVTWGRSPDYNSPMGVPGCPGFSENYRLPPKNGRKRAFKFLSEEEKAISGFHFE